jgi:hypothetical protein
MPVGRGALVRDPRPAAVGYKFFVHPYFADKLKGETGSASQYKHEIIVAADSFSGYAILRSDRSSRISRRSRSS